MEIIKIIKAEHIAGYVIKIFFSDGTVQNVDFGPFLESSIHPEVRKFLNLKKFRQFKVKHNDLMWGDFDLIFPISDLYNNSLVQNRQAG